jgi:hypothetical protein
MTCRHTLSVYPKSKPPPVQIHTVSMVNDTSDACNKESVIILAQVQAMFTDGADPSTASISNKTATIFAQKEERQPINLNIVLIDSQLTVDLLYNPGHVQNICLAKYPICVHCNKRMLATTEEADFGDMPAYFNSRGIVNILSLYCLGKKMWVTYNSSNCNGVYQVNTKKGIVEFKQTPKGWHTLNLKDNPKVAYQLVNGAELLLPTPDTPPAHQIHVNTVHDNYEGYSCKQIEQYTAVQHLMNMVATPSACDF